MSKLKNYKGEKTKQSKAEMLDEMVPIRSIERTKAKLRELKAEQMNKTVPYYSTKYGYSRLLILYLPPNTPKETVKAKFEARFNGTTINQYNVKKGLRV